MLTLERHKEILDILNRKNAVTVSELAKALNTSESTVRRDLNTLDKQKKLNKVFGGATAIRQMAGAAENKVSYRENINTAEKEAIARYAASLIHDDDFVFIDAGTTTSKLVDFITNDKATYVTNGIEHGLKLLRKGFNAYLIGGRIKPVTESVVGAEGVKNLSGFNFTKAFLGTNGIDIKAGFTTPDLEEARIKQTAIEKSYVSFVLADSSKFRITTPITFGNLSSCCIITDKKIPGEWSDYTAIKIVNNG